MDEFSDDNEDSHVMREEPRSSTPPPRYSKPSAALLSKSPPTFGSPSRDTHNLRDDDMPMASDRPLFTQYVHTPMKGGDSRDVACRRMEISPSKRPPAGVPTMIPEGMSFTYNTPVKGDNLYMSAKGDNVREKVEDWRCKGVPRHRLPLSDDEDDDISLSNMSIASSSSLASQVLARAQQRQQFWGKNGQKVATR